jgi:hypothetical protein
LEKGKDVFWLMVSEGSDHGCLACDEAENHGRKHEAEGLAHLMAAEKQRGSRTAQGANIPFKGTPPMT